MNDEPDLELEAASAALDDLATPEERALVDASPALQAEVERFARLRDRIADVEVPAAARESALAAALAAFDDAHPQHEAAAAVIAPPNVSGNVVSLESRRRRQSGILAAAAAAVAVLAIGAVALNSGGSDDDSASETVAGATVPILASEAAETADADRQFDVAVTDAPAAPATTAEAADEAPAATDAAQPAADQAAPAPAETSAASVVPAIETPEELLSYASSTRLVEETTAETTGATTADTDAPVDTTAAAESTALEALYPFELCVSDETEYLGDVRYQGELAHVVRVIDSGEIRALAADDCQLLAFATP